MALFEGTCLWAKVLPDQLDKTYAKEKTGGTWSIELVITKDNIKAIRDEGLEHLVHTKDDGTKVLKFKRNEISKSSGKPNTPPKVVDKSMQPILQEIGNGSKVLISASTYVGFKSKKYPTLQAVQVLDHIVFERKVKGEFNPFDPSLNKDKSEFVVKDTSKPEEVEDDGEVPFDLDKRVNEI